MTPAAIAVIRKALGLSQVEFGQLFGAHFMTISKWERGLAQPSPYQIALMEQFARTAQAKQAEAQEEVKKLLIGAGVVAALIWLLTAAKK
jgi:transcriptional regulator with XRE-family HTH domain